MSVRSETSFIRADGARVTIRVEGGEPLSPGTGEESRPGFEAMPPLDAFLRPPAGLRESVERAKAKATATTVRNSLRAAQPPVVQPLAAGSPVDITDPVLRDRSLTGGFTVVARLFGDTTQLHRRCLNSIIETVPTSLRRLFVLCQKTGEGTDQLIRGLDATSRKRDNDYKWDAFRRLLDEEDLAGGWLLWFDDVAYARQRNWLNILAKTLTLVDEKTAGLGRILSYPLPAGSLAWFEKSGWWRGLLHNKQRKLAPNGDRISYLSPNFMALRILALKQMGVLDPRIRQSGGGIVLGAQLLQAGWSLKDFPSMVSAEQPNLTRGLAQKYPWLS